MVSRPRHLGVVLRGPAVALAVAGVALALSHPATPAARLLFGHVTTVSVLAVAGLFAIATLAVRVLRRPHRGAAFPVGRQGGAFGDVLARTPIDVALGAIVGCSFGVWLAVARAAHLPSVFGDELVYSGLGKGIARGEGLSLLGSSQHGYGVLYPLVIAPSYVLARDGVAAYEWIKTTNALAMSLAAVVAYFVARRVAPPGWALVVSGLTVAVPAMAYTRLVMTGPLAYPAFLLAALTLVRALERPTAARQVVALATLAAAIGVRLQAVALIPALVSAVVLFGSSSRDVRGVLRRFVPTWALLALGGAAALVAAEGHPSALLGSYSVLVRHYGLRELLEWLVWTTAMLELAAAIVPLFAACVVTPRLLRRSARPGERAVGAVAVSWTIWTVASTVVISASPYGLGRMHERNLFYVLPLLFACLAYWIVQGRPLDLRVAVPALVLLAGMPLALTHRLVHTDSAFDAPSLFTWANLEPHLGPIPVVAAIAVTAVVVVGWASFSRLTILPVLVVLTLFYTVIAEAAYREPATAAAERAAWIDRALPSSARATLIYVDVAARCRGTPSAPLDRMRLAEFFDVSVDRVVRVPGAATTRGLATDPISVEANGVVVGADGPLRADYVVAESGVRLVGRRLAAAPTRGGLTLWRPAKPLRLASPWAVARRLSGHVSCSLRSLLATQ